MILPEKMQHFYPKYIKSATKFIPSLKKRDYCQFSMNSPF
jgi:hypothetical protein